MSGEGVDKASTRPPWDWSAKHSRLRFQLVTTAILFFSIKKYCPDLSSLRLPFSIINYNGNPSQQTLEICVASFFLFTLVTFLLRSYNERNRFDLTDEALLAAISSLGSKIDGFVKELYIISELDGDKSQNGILHSLREWDRSISERRMFRPSENDMFKEVGENISRTKDLLDEVVSELGNPSTESKSVERISPIVETMKHFLDSSIDCRKEFIANWDSLANQVSEAADQTRTSVSLAINDLKSASSGFKESLSSFSAEARETKRILVKESNRRFKYVPADRDFGGVVVPVIVSLVIFGFSFSDFHFLLKD